jgi:hypothetical protein
VPQPRVATTCHHHVPPSISPIDCRILSLFCGRVRPCQWSAGLSVWRALSWLR